MSDNITQYLPRWKQVISTLMTEAGITVMSGHVVGISGAIVSISGSCLVSGSTMVYTVGYNHGGY